MPLCKIPNLYGFHRAVVYAVQTHIAVEIKLDVVVKSNIVSGAFIDTLHTFDAQIGLRIKLRDVLGVLSMKRLFGLLGDQKR